MSEMDVHLADAAAQRSDQLGFGKMIDPIF